MADEEVDGVVISSFPNAPTIDNSDAVTGLHNGNNANFLISAIVAHVRQGLNNIFVPTSRKVNNKPLNADITLGASDVGAVSTSAVGSANGVASLDTNGIVPSSQLPTIPSSADDISYDNTASGLTATNAQDAIDEVYGDIPSQPSDIGAQSAITANGILKGDGAGGVSAAVAGTDYQAPIDLSIVNGKICVIYEVTP